MAEDHPLVIRSPWKKPFTGRADAVLAIGFRFWSGEKFGEPPTWSESARYAQAGATPTWIGLKVPAEVFAGVARKLRILRGEAFTSHSVSFIKRGMSPLNVLSIRGSLLGAGAGV